MVWYTVSTQFFTKISPNVRCVRVFVGWSSLTKCTLNFLKKYCFKKKNRTTQHKIFPQNFHTKNNFFSKKSKIFPNILQNKVQQALKFSQKFTPKNKIFTKKISKFYPQNFQKKSKEKHRNVPKKWNIPFQSALYLSATITVCHFRAEDWSLVCKSNFRNTPPKIFTKFSTKNLQKNACNDMPHSKKTTKQNDKQREPSTVPEIHKKLFLNVVVRVWALSHCFPRCHCQIRRFLFHVPEKSLTVLTDVLLRPHAIIHH